MSRADVSTFFVDDPAGCGFHLVDVQDETAAIEANKAQQNDGTNGWSDNKNWKALGDIPILVIKIWEKQDGVDIMAMPAGEQSAYLRRKLQDSDYALLRADKGHGLL